MIRFYAPINASSVDPMRCIREFNSQTRDSHGNMWSAGTKYSVEEGGYSELHQNSYIDVRILHDN